MNEAAKQALRDISDDYNGVRQTHYTDSNNVKCIDTWFVGGSYLYNVENTALNREVGAAYLNSGGYRVKKPVDGFALMAEGLTKYLKK